MEAQAMKRALTLLLALMLLTGSAEGLPSRATATDTWSPVNGPTGGSVSALAISPDYAYDHTAYAGLRGKGIYRTDDGGLSWKLTSPDDWVIVDLAISPAYATDQALFAVTGFGTTGYTVYRSTDAGGTWQAPTMAPSGGLQNLPYLLLSPPPPPPPVGTFTVAGPPKVFGRWAAASPSPGGGPHRRISLRCPDHVQCP